ncbi:phosphotransferase [Streptomyces sp. AK02-04a]|uniref:phosphotransferase n=1 Tax=Streptomyces sp. AK02-04a TaxID=3028649 RepID=UPI0029B7FED3|nr:phosphotransferase [Streptomyces sp. AK02-04a]MDX3763809.1 phosphotransferase [Streptomyces sp. AK02-04a]
MATHRLSSVPADALAVIEATTGPVERAEMVSAGLNSEIAARVQLRDGRRIFVKGMRSDHRWVWTQRREADINAHTRGLAPELKWHATGKGWNLLAFEDLGGKHADYMPGSPDLELVIQAMWTLSTATAPASVDLKTMPSRLSAHVEEPDDLQAFAGTHLLHTDWKPDNVLITGGRARLVDWGWASLGAAWIDPALWVIWLIASGHTPEEAEALAHRHPAWDRAPVSRTYR